MDRIHATIPLEILKAIVGLCEVGHTCLADVGRWRGLRLTSLVPRTRRSVTSTVRCRAGAQVSALCYVGCWVPALRRNATRCTASGTGEEAKWNGAR